jgi:hypothetical protein
MFDMLRRWPEFVPDPEEEKPVEEIAVEEKPADEIPTKEKADDEVPPSVE